MQTHNIRIVGFLNRQQLLSCQSDQGDCVFRHCDSKHLSSSFEASGLTWRTVELVDMTLLTHLNLIGVLRMHIIILLLSAKLGSVGSIEQEIKLPWP